MRASSRKDRARRPARLPLVLEGGIGLALTYLVLLRWWWGRWLDTTVYGLVLNGVDGSVRRALSLMARDVLPVLLAVVLLTLAPSLALSRKTPAPVVLLTAVPLATGAAYLLRTRVVRASSAEVVGAHSFPSTHVAAVTSMLLVLWFLTGTQHRFRGMLAAAVVLAAVGNVSWYAHLPSDALGGVLVAVTVTAGGRGIADRVAGRAPERRATGAG